MEDHVMPVVNEFPTNEGQPVLRFSPFNETSWRKLYGEDHQQLNFNMHVVIDKGFSYSSEYGCFVNQKKNHFQVSVNIEPCNDYSPTYVAVNGVLKPIQKMQLAFCGVKSEMHSTIIELKQSQNDRKPGVRKPVELKELPPRQVTKVTVPHLHFSETTLYNNWKNNKPNPEQRYFLLLVRLIAVTVDGLEHLVLAHASDRFVVRATAFASEYNRAPESQAALNNAERERHNEEVDANDTVFAPVLAAPDYTEREEQDARLVTKDSTEIRFAPFNETSWEKLYGSDQNPLNYNMNVVIEKGFNYSFKDGCFINQKKNPFQVSVNIEACDDHSPTQIAVNGVLKPIRKLQLAFCAVPDEMPTQFREIRQSQNDHRPRFHKPIELKEIPPRQVTKVTVPRLHFSETTLNNQRKNNKPNPDQKYFLLLVRLIAVTVDGLEHLVIAYASDRVIVRATHF